MQRKLGMGTLVGLMQKHYGGIRYETAQMIHYVSFRSRGTDAHIKRLVLADKIPGFDWDSVTRGDEDDELKKYAI